MLKNTLLAMAAVVATTGMAAAQYPDKPITMIVPWAAGGGTDAIARTLANGLHEKLGVPVTVVNRPGGAGVVGHNAMIEAPKDGYTIGLATAEMVTYYWTGNAKFTEKDFTPISLVNFDAGAFQVAANSPWKNVKEALADIKSHPKGTYKMSGSAVGSAYQIAFAGFLKQQGIDPLQVTMVPSQGAAPGFQQLVAGGVSIIPSSLPEGRTMMQAGQVKALAVFSDKRNPSFPDVPTAGEQTGTPYAGGTWRGVVGPKGMDPAAQKVLETAVKEVVKSKPFTDFMTKQGFGIEFLDAAAFGTFLADQQKTVGETLNAIGLATRKE